MQLEGFLKRKFPKLYQKIRSFHGAKNGGLVMVQTKEAPTQILPPIGRLVLFNFASKQKSNRGCCCFPRLVMCHQTLFGKAMLVPLQIHGGENAKKK